MTPYSSDGFHHEAMALARRGFVFAAVSVRGRGSSEGEFEPWNNDGRDGHDVVEWLAGQPWSSGKVGMMGHSYGGRAVWSTLKEAPPHLASALPIAASFPMRTSNNIQTPDALQWIVYTSGATHNLKLLTDTQFWWEKYRELYFSGRPQRDFDLIVGFRSKLFQTMRDHPTLDAYCSTIPCATVRGRLCSRRQSAITSPEPRPGEARTLSMKPRGVGEHFIFHLETDD